MTVTVARVEATACHVTHEPSGRQLETDTPAEYGGQGRAFSSTDLVAAALGSCLATSIAPILERAGRSLHDVRIYVRKTLSQRPRRIERLAVQIALGPPADERLTKKVLRAAEACPVRRSLHPAVEVTIGIAGAP